jgi:hypothetical protein
MPRLNETKSWFFEKINKVDKLNQTDQKMEKETKLIKLKMRNEIISQQTPMKFRGILQNFIREYFKNVYARGWWSGSRGRAPW